MIRVKVTGDEALTCERAIRSCGIVDAHLLFLKGRIGSPGRALPADSVVIDRDIPTCPEDG
jgi:hypothetical protein